jgi:hypothetical protein
VKVWREVNLAYAKELGKQPQVPSVVVGGQGGGGTQQIMELLKLRTMQDIGLDLKVRK